MGEDHYAARPKACRGARPVIHGAEVVAAGGGRHLCQQDVVWRNRAALNVDDPALVVAHGGATLLYDASRKVLEEKIARRAAAAELGVAVEQAGPGHHDDGYGTRPSG